MPRIKLTLPPPAVPWTKIPNLFLDHILATLTDTEARVLLVVFRRTNGWNREGEFVTVSYRDLKRSTGRQSEAIARALRSLEAKRLIHIPGAGMHRGAVNAALAASETEDQQEYRKVIKTIPKRRVIHKPP